MVAGQVAKVIRGVILADPTFLSPRRQREVRDSDVAEQHRRVLSLGKGEVLAQTQARHARRSSEIVELGRLGPAPRFRPLNGSVTRLSKACDTMVG